MGPWRSNLLCGRSSLLHRGVGDWYSLTPCLICFCCLVSIFYTISTTYASGFFIIVDKVVCACRRLGGPPRADAGGMGPPPPAARRYIFMQGPVPPPSAWRARKDGRGQSPSPTWHPRCKMCRWTPLLWKKGVDKSAILYHTIRQRKHAGIATAPRLCRSCYT